ncbi:MAG: hydroxyethylthiazole kinase-like uncharacterized protein yjeF [Sphingobacteriales bacterium]|jgi:hydroxyethylthiazole kinase-like uncharacterized protein yjeF
MKVFSSEKIKEIDRLTCVEEGIKSIDLMERASKNWVNTFKSDFPEIKRVIVFCGLGNNGGDGLAIARLLKTQKVEVRVVILRYSETVSPDFLINEQLLQSVGLEVVNCPFERFPELKEDELIIDAILGNGINRPTDGIIKEVIQKINGAGNFVISVDLPSGLFGDLHTPKNNQVIKASRVYTFQFPKLALFMPENGDFAPEFKVIDIGLPAALTDNFSAKAHYLTKDLIFPIWKPRAKFSYKNNFGHGLVIGGSIGMMGAPLIAAEACLRGGAGLVSGLMPNCGLKIFQTVLPQVMCLKHKNEEILKGVVPDLSKYTAIAIGPGMGTDPETGGFLIEILNEGKVPMVLDADALNLLAGIKDAQYPENTILTPHEGELKGLIGTWLNDFDKIAKAQNFAVINKIILIVKGAHTCVIDSNGELFFNSTGNPSLAKAGSGDLLTGILLSFLCQGESAIISSKKAVLLHGLLADKATESSSEHGIVIQDLMKQLSEAENF